MKENLKVFRYNGSDIAFNTENSDLAAVKAYFESILALTQSNVEYPVKLAEVWPLVYNQKSDAVKALQRDFVQGLDYQVLSPNPQNCSAGRPSQEYVLSVACLEYLIVRKVRPVFEVYRQVFHKVAGRPQLPQDYLSALKALVVAVEEKEKVQAQLIVAKPKVEYCDKVLSATNSVTTTQIAKEYGWSAAKLNAELHKMGVQFKQSGQWHLYAKYADKGYVQSATFTFKHKDGAEGACMATRWTQSGRKLIYDLLKEDGVVPVKEVNDKLLNQ